MEIARAAAPIIGHDPDLVMICQSALPFGYKWNVKLGWYDKPGKFPTVEAEDEALETAIERALKQLLDVVQPAGAA